MFQRDLDVWRESLSPRSSRRFLDFTFTHFGANALRIERKQNPARQRA